MKRRRWLRGVMIGLLAVAVILALNEIVSFPLAFRAGDPNEWLGPGPAGPPRQRALRLLDLEPTAASAPFLNTMRDDLAGFPILAEGSPYGTSATLGVHKHWESNRPVILAPTPAAMSYSMTVPTGARLTFGFGVPGLLKDKLQAGARFIVEWDGPQGRQRLFEREIVPARPGFWEKNETRERLWFRYLQPRFTRRGDLFEDAEIDLSSHAGETGELRLLTELMPGPHKKEYSPSVWSDPEIWAPRPAGEAPPVNVLIFMIEATPTTMVEPFHHDRAATPNLRRLAEQGAAFDKFFTVGDSTQLSTFSYFTGLHYKRMGLPNEIYYLAPLVKARFYRHRFATLAEAFSSAGYKTAEFGTNHYFLPTREFGLDLGFDQIEILGRRNYAHIDTTLAAMQWLRQNGAKPFMLYIHYDAPHDEEKPDLAMLARALAAGGKDWRWRYRKYLAQVMRADRDLGEMIAALESLGVRERTLIVVTSDHGNCVIPAHEFAVLRPDRRPWWTPFQHGRAMSAEDINPPLVLAGPGVKHTIEIDHTPLASVDLFPTLVDLLLPDLPADLRSRLSSLDGRSFAGRLDPAGGKSAGGHEVIYSISQGGEVAVGEGRWHYAARAPGFDKLLYPGTDRLTVVREALFDLTEDPEELHDLAPAGPLMLDRMRTVLADARPAEDRLRLLYFNFPSGRVRGRLGLGSGEGRVSQAITFPEGRRPIELRPVEISAGTTTEAAPVKIFEFEVDLEGPTGLVLEDPVQWVELVHDDTPLAASELRLGPYGLPLLASAPATAAARFDLEGPGTLSASELLSSRHPAFYMTEPGAYFHLMGFSDFVAGTFSDEELSPAVRSILKQWGYIE